MENNSNDLYQILGVEKDSDESTIKKAYRKKALKWHPDKNSHQKEEAEKMFKKISEAYSILSDKDKREIYDKYGMDGINNMEQGGPGINPFDLFQEFFSGPMPGGFHFMNGFPGNSFNRRQSVQPLIHQLNLTLEEVFTGTKKKITLNRKIKKENDDKLYDESEELEIEIPKGCLSHIKKEGLGHKIEGVDNGDLIIQIVPIEHNSFKLNPKDSTCLIYEKNIDFGSSLLGFSFTLNTIDNQYITI